jgi:hypothetical protein
VKKTDTPPFYFAKQERNIMSRGRKKIVVDKTEFQNEINKLESDGSFKNMGKLFEAVEQTEWAKNCKDEDGNVKPLKAQSAYLRFKEMDLDADTKKGKAGRGRKSKETQESEPEVVTPAQKRSASMAAYFGAKKMTRIPAGKCPVKLGGTSYDEVSEWCDAIQEIYRLKNECLAYEGLLYFINYNFYDSTTKEYHVIKDHIDAWMGEKGLNIEDYNDD